ncbi:histidine phosphatase family protein [Lentilactobacillus sp. Marseille-Q4993]|uniref:histidine phosphatase family protein n=1 Tax=Lentilactobacillus sp. Marseille-Q4993 TaxID=3039492 RepID=UPI0024BC1D67|nr:histidine phosphatase family protein [Lentilactobacillus sp. Marseille-Q4993]
MTRLYFVRHGKTEWNLESRYQGAGGDSPLLEQSYQEIKQVGEFLKDIEFAHIYASPIKRARDTALGIRKQLSKQPPITFLSRLEEFHLGKMEGMKFADVKAEFPEEAENFKLHPDKYDNSVIGGESYPDVIARMTPAIQEIVQANPDQNVLIVSHGAALNAEMNHLLGASLPDLKKRGGLANTSTTIIDSNEAGTVFSLVKWNDTEYLNREISETDIV